MALRDRLRQVLSLKDSPHHIALSFAVGIFLGMSPLIGLHTVLGLAAAWIFRLNKFVTILGVFVTNPWTIVPIYTFSTWLGIMLLGGEGVLPDIDWKGLDLLDIGRGLESLLLPFVAGSTLLGLVSAIVAYGILYSAVKRRRTPEQPIER